MRLFRKRKRHAIHLYDVFDAITHLEKTCWESATAAANGLPSDHPDRAMARSQFVASSRALHDLIRRFEEERR